MEAAAQGDAGVPLGREQQFARIFSATKDVHNIVYLTANVHCPSRDLLSSRPPGVSRCLVASPLARQDFAGLYDRSVSLQSESDDGTGDDPLLELIGPFENVKNLSVAVHPLDRIFTLVTVSAEDLDGPFRRPYRNPAGLQL